MAEQKLGKSTSLAISAGVTIAASLIAKHFNIDHATEGVSVVGIMPLAATAWETAADVTRHFLGVETHDMLTAKRHHVVIRDLTTVTGDAIASILLDVSDELRRSPDGEALKRISGRASKQWQDSDKTPIRESELRALFSEPWEQLRKHSILPVHTRDHTNVHEVRTLSWESIVRWLSLEETGRDCKGPLASSISDTTVLLAANRLCERFNEVVFQGVTHNGVAYQEMQMILMGQIVSGIRNLESRGEGSTTNAGVVDSITQAAVDEIRDLLNGVRSTVDNQADAAMLHHEEVLIWLTGLHTDLASAISSINLHTTTVVGTAVGQLSYKLDQIALAQQERRVDIRPHVDLKWRRYILDIVRKNWIDGGLHKGIWSQARLVPGLELRPDAVTRPCDLALRRSGLTDTAIPPGTAIISVYRQETERLLIMGAKGSGKSTLLLELAETLLDEAERIANSPVPIVVDLSTWGKRHSKLDKWLVEQLTHPKGYRIPPEMARRWVSDRMFTVLLDGLDEVKEPYRSACVKGINDYCCADTAFGSLVVCCRTQDYGIMPMLHLNGAVVVRPLTIEQVDEYLDAGGERLAGLRAMLHEKSSLYTELFTTPLMLSVAATIYEGQSAADLRDNVPREVREQLMWDAYIDKMICRKLEHQQGYQSPKALDWLAWMGAYLNNKGHNLYRIEDMQPVDLLYPYQMRSIRWTFAVLATLLAFRLDMLLMLNHVLPASLIALPWLFIGYSRDIEVDRQRSIDLNRLHGHWKTIIGTGVVATVCGGVIGAQIGAMQAPNGAVIGAESCAMLGAWFGIMIESLGFMLNEKDLEGQIRPNSGIRHSLRTVFVPYKVSLYTQIVVTAFMFLTLSIVAYGVHVIFSKAGPTVVPSAYAAVVIVSILGSVMVIGVVHGGRMVAAMSVYIATYFLTYYVGAHTPARYMTDHAIHGLLVGLFAMTFFSCIVGCQGGIRTVFQHYMLRCILAQNGQFPYRIVPFLDWAAQRIILQRKNGGWEFIHRDLMLRFSERYHEKQLTGSAMPKN